eukprot:659689-Pelagomonas_calceolata.AAC.1
MCAHSPAGAGCGGDTVRPGHSCARRDTRLRFLHCQCVELCTVECCVGACDGAMAGAGPSGPQHC